jgi:hypothetical protein
MLGPRAIDFVAATAVLQTFTATLALLPTSCVSCSVPNKRNDDLLPIRRVVPCFDRQLAAPLLWHRPRLFEKVTPRESAGNMWRWRPVARIKYRDRGYWDPITCNLVKGPES